MTFVQEATVNYLNVGKVFDHVKRRLLLCTIEKCVILQKFYLSYNITPNFPSSFSDKTEAAPSKLIQSVFAIATPMTK